MSSIIIYGKSNCPYTAQARQFHAGHTYFDVIQDPSRLQEMLKLSEGKRRVPVIVVDGKVSVGFNGS